MGCCSNFQATWWPTPDSDVIDPNKEFNRQRRLSIFRRFTILLLFVAFLIGLIFLVTSLTSGDKSNSEALMMQIVPTNESLQISSFPGIVSLGSTSGNNLSVSKLPQEDVESWCSNSKQDILDCVALSKNFRVVKTFSNQRENNTGAVEGYLMVKLKSDKWHPYCHQNWTLNMGYTLCKEMGFKELVQLQTIGIYELRQRVTKLGDQVSLQPQGELHPQQDLIVLEGSQSNSLQSKPDQTNSEKYKCDVGFISCK